MKTLHKPENRRKPKISCKLPIINYQLTRKFALLFIVFMGVCSFVQAQAQAQIDRIVTSLNLPVTFDARDNDNTGTCDKDSLDGFGIIPNSGLLHGTLTVNPDSTFIYRPQSGFYGIDSLSYYIKCGADSSVAKIYIMVLNPLAGKYIACLNSSVIMGFNAISNVVYYWYNAETGGTQLTSGNTYTVTKNSTPLQIFWIESRYKSIIFPRFKMDFELGNCNVAVPTGCAVTGTVIWKEDFDRYDDGLNPSSNVRSTEQLPAGMTTYAFGIPGQIEGVYALLKRGTYGWESVLTDDHTSLGNPNIGRCLLINGKTTEDRVYIQSIDNLCSGNELYFSFWMRGSTAQLIWTIYAADGRKLAEFGRVTNSNSWGSWLLYGFKFTVPAGETSIKFEIYNKDATAGGNDFAIDDIEIRFCSPKADITNPATDNITVCRGTLFTLTGEYTDDGTFTGSGQNLVSHWEYSATGNMTDHSEWTVLSGSHKSNPNASTYITNSYTIPSLGTENEGYYRLVVSNAANIGNYNCNAMSDRVRLQVTATSGVIPGTVSSSDTVCYGYAPNQLTTTPAAGAGAYTYQWEQKEEDSNVWVNATGSSMGTTYNPPVLTVTTRYRLKVTGDLSACNTAYSNEVEITVNPICAFDDYVTTSCDAMPVTIDVLANDTIHCSTSVVVSVVKGAATVTGNNEIIYAGALSGLDTVTYRVTCGNDSVEAKVYITVDASGSAFVDDVWYFGLKDVNGKSPGIRFVKDENGEYVAQDASGESMINTAENCMVISSPYCDGQIIFYANHNRLYNSLHEPMLNGTFLGDISITDGLAACYMGDNKYLFFATTAPYQFPPRGLNAYIINMNGDNGKGELMAPIIPIETAHVNMSEGIGLIPRAGTTNQYWLFYGHCNGSCTSGYSNEVRLRLVDVSTPNNPSIATTYSRITKTTSMTYSMRISQQYNRIAIINVINNSVDVFDFNNSTGVLSNLRNISIGGIGALVQLEFSPDGNQLYISKYDNVNLNTPVNAYLYQYDISGAPSLISYIKYWTQTTSRYKGGGLKLGPDNKIYVQLSYDNKIGAISDLNLKTPLENRYNVSMLTLSVNGGEYFSFSTGLTKSAIMACNINTPPTTQADSTDFCVSPTSRTAKSAVLKNDVDAENNTIYLTDVNFANLSDENLATLSMNATSDTVILTLNSGVVIDADGHVFEIIYDVKDNGLPASQCATGMLKVKAYPQPNYPDVRVRICPDAGKIVNLSKYLDTISLTSVKWESISPNVTIINTTAGIISTDDLKTSSVYTFVYTANSCATDFKRKVYLETLKPERMRPLKDSVVICYRYAEALQLNQLFGIEADGTWSYYSDGDNITPYITESTSPTHNGAVIMNGKAIYETFSAGGNPKRVKITYTSASNSCLAGKSYSITIVLTSDITN